MPRPGYHFQTAFPKVYAAVCCLSDLDKEYILVAFFLFGAFMTS